MLLVKENIRLTIAPISHQLGPLLPKKQKGKERKEEKLKLQRSHYGKVQKFPKKGKLEPS